MRSAAASPVNKECRGLSYEQGVPRPLLLMRSAAASPINEECRGLSCYNIKECCGLSYNIKECRGLSYY